MKFILLLAIAAATGYVAYDAFYGEEILDMALPPIESVDVVME